MSHLAQVFKTSVVVGYRRDEVVERSRTLGISVVRNLGISIRGCFSSIQAGVATLNPKVQAFFHAC